MYKKDLALNDQQCHKTHPNQTKNKGNKKILANHMPFHNI